MNDKKRRGSEKTGKGKVNQGERLRVGKSGKSSSSASTFLGVEALEERTLLAVTSSLSLGVLNIALGAAADAATVSIVGPNVDVFDGIVHTTFPTASVLGIKAQGTGAANQKLTLQSNVELTQSLLVSQLSTTFINGSYRASLVDVSSTEIYVTGGVISTRTIGVGGDPATALSLGNSGPITLAGSVINATAGGKILANATGIFNGGLVKILAVDSKNGVNAQAAATITFTNAIIRGRDVLIDAAASVTATAAKPLDTAGANLANLDVKSTATILLSGSTEVTGAGFVTIASHSTSSTTATALAFTTSSNTAIDAAVARSKVISTSVAHVAGTSKVNAGGVLTVSASNATAAATTADGSGSGTNAGGASVAIADITLDTKAYADEAATITAGAVQVATDSIVKVTTNSKSTVRAVTANTASTTSTLTSNNAKSSGGAIALGAAVSVTNLNDNSAAFVASSAPITATNDLKVDALSTTVSSATADSTVAASSGTKTGEGVSVAIDRVKKSNKASIGGVGAVSAAGVAVNATNKPGLPNYIDANAISGVSKKNTTIEGAAAFAIGSVANEAFIAGGALVNALNQDVSISASGDTSSVVSAKPAPSSVIGQPAKGVGASLGVNILSDTTRAELENNATLTNAKNLSLTTNAHESMTTIVEAGADPTAAGTTFTGFSAAVGISVLNTSTTSRVGQGSPTTLGGDLVVNATHQAEVANTVGGNVAGAGVLGASLALSVTSSRTTATVDRNLDVAGNISITTQADLAAGATAKASARGGRQKTGSTPANAVDSEVGSQVGLADFEAASLGVAGTGGPTTPSAKTGGGGATAAAAIAINLVTASRSDATIAPGRTVKSGGILFLSAANDTDARSKADGSTTFASGSGVGAGVAVNVIGGESSRALIGPGSSITAKSLTLDAKASTTGDGVNSASADALSGVGAAALGVAGSLAINVAKLSTEAVVGAGSTIALSGGNLTLSATNKTKATTSATPSLGISSAAKGLGLSFGVNVLDDTTRAEVEDGVGITGAKNVSLEAGSRDDMTTLVQTGLQATSGSSFAAAAGATALTAATTARLGTGATLSNTNDVDISASHSDSVKTNSGGEAVAAGGTSLGAAVSVNVTTVNTVAKLDRDLNAGGTLNVSATNASTSDAIAKATSKGGKIDNGTAPSTAADSEATSQKKQIDDAAASAGALVLCPI